MLALVALNPVPASRPRVTRWGTYYAKTYKGWRDAAHSTIEQFKGEPLEGPLVVEIDTLVQRPKTSKRSYPRGDADNFAKAILDAITGTKADPKGYWNDDDQIVDLRIRKRFVKTDEDPGYYTTITEADPNTL